MACLNMLNNEQQAGYCSNAAAMGPRISFSNDFADSKQSTIGSTGAHENSYREAPVSSDFEFSVSGNTLISADELFFKGKLLPLMKDDIDNHHPSNKLVTLRDELLASGEDDCDDIFQYHRHRLPRNSGWWKEKLGLKRNQVGLGPNSKKADQKNFGGLETIDEARKPPVPVFANITGRS